MAYTRAELEVWRRAAARKLDDQADRVARYQSYYDGTELIPAILDTEERQTFSKLLYASRATWAELIVNAVAERLTVTGFGFGPSSDRAWLLWQANHMDADGELSQTVALTAGLAPVLVQPDEDNPVGVTITAESPEEACVLYAPGSRYRRVAGYKRFEDADHNRTEILLLPDVIVTWEGPANDPFVEDNPAGLIGMIEIIPQPRIKGPPRSELEPALPIQDRINTTIFSRMVATDYGAFQQKWASGVKMAREVLTDENGGIIGEELKPPFKMGPHRLWVSENPDSRFGAINADPLAGFLNAVEQDINQMAAISQTPTYYLQPIQNLSADAIKAAEAGLVSKIRRRARHIGEGWEEVMRVALGLVGDEGAADVAGETIWGDFETRSLAQLADALTKMAGLGVPTEVLWHQYGASPQEIQQWKRLAAEESAQTAANQAAALGAADIAALLGGTSGQP